MAGRRIRIPPFTQKVQMDKSFVTSTWNKLRDAIIQIQHQNESELSYEELYRNCYNLVLNREDRMLYEGLIQVVQSHMQDLAAKVEASIGELFLSTLIRVWDDHQTAMQMIKDILMYLDKKLVTDRSESVNELGLTRFLDIVVRRDKISLHLRTLLLEMVENERNGEGIERGLVKAASTMLVALGVDSLKIYELDFESYFLLESSDFYKRESQEFLQSHNASVYLQRVEDRLKQEKERVEHCLDASTEVKIIRVVEQELITEHMLEIITMEGSGLVYMLENDRVEDLRRMFNIIGRVPNGLETLRDHFRKHLESRGKMLVTDEAAQGGSKVAVRFVKSLVDLKAKYDRLASEGFNDHRLFLQAVNSAFVSVINLNERSPEFISMFIDDRLKKGIKEMVETELELVIDKTLDLFRFLKDKDIFERYYKQHLAKRLILNKTSSDETELSVISKLKAECGYSFTQKLEGMFKDIRTSRDFMNTFQNYLSSLPDSRAKMGNVDLHVRVLTTGYWPTSQRGECELPLEMQHACSTFTSFYTRSHQGRKITWQFNWGNADVSGIFKAKTHILSVSTFQAVILCLFNSLGPDETMTFQEMCDATKIPENELKRAVLTLALGKARVLTKKPMSKAIEPNHAFGVNAKFTSKMNRVKVHQIVAKETPIERETTKVRIEEERKHLMEACLVRVMKSRKELHHNQLVTEATEALKDRFVPTPNDLKKRIESLIERDYLERSSQDRKVYKYLA